MEGIQHTAMQVLFDMLFAFNLSAIETDAADDSEVTNLSTRSLSSAAADTPSECTT